MPGFSVKEGKPSNLQGLALGGAHGLLSGLQSFAADRLAQMRAQNEQRKLQDTFRALNLSPAEQSDILHLLPPEQRLSGLQALAGLQPQQQAVQQQPKTLEQEPTLLAAAQEQRAQELRPDQSQVTPTQNEPPKMSDVIAEIKKMGLGVPNKIQRNQLENIIKDFNPANAPVPVQQPQQPAAMAPQIPSPVIQTIPSMQPQASSVQESVSRFGKPLTEAQRLAESRKDREEEISREEKSAKRREEIHGEAKQAKEMRSNIKDLKKNILSGKNEAPLAIAAFRNMGWPENVLNAMMSPETAQSQNIIKNFLAVGPTMFGGKVSEGEMNVLLSAFPSLETNPRGALLMLEIMDKHAQKAVAEERVLNSLTKEKGGLPRYWQEVLSEKLDEEYEKIDKAYEHNVERIGKMKIPNEPTAAGAFYAGTIAPLLGGLARASKRGLEYAAATGTGALAGGALGSIVPGLGTAAGGLGGAIAGGGGLALSDLLGLFKR